MFTPVDQLYIVPTPVTVIKRIIFIRGDGTLNSKFMVS